MAKRIVLSDGNKVNSKGFRIDFSGMNTEKFTDNPVMPYKHNQDKVIGRWENWTFTENTLHTDPQTDMVTQSEIMPETENKNETQEIPSNSGQNAVETVGSGKSEPTEKTAQRDRIAKDIFVKNSGESVLYFTNDMIPFFEKTDAIKHSKGLDDKIIVTINK